MLLSALGYHADNDSLRQRLDDTEEALRVHVQMLAAATEESERRESQHRYVLQQLREQQHQEQQQRPAGRPQMWYAAVVRAVTGRASRSLLRSVLRASAVFACE